eukprot:TRINITY_DN1797_c0_g1_i2.p1 TRINITY_DN1797_c0_g1~~TRINITY_DN1797_c0_g1_i2.p1  ORF type:complete len:1183 (+),score=181.24 TRINITY_DN1797_c0_g1_i2:229-3549(+)
MLKLSFDRLWNDLARCIYRFLAHGKMKPNIQERIVSFVVLITLEFDGQSEVSVCQKLVDDLLRKLHAKDANVRLRAISIISEIVSNIPAEHKLSGDTLDEVIEELLDCSRDSSSLIRAASLVGLRRFQDPYDEEDSVFATIRYCLAHDSAVNVRKSALLNIGCNEDTMPLIMMRLRDNSAEVRAAALSLVQQAFDIKSLPAGDIASVVKLLRDTDTQVKDACARMIFGGWLTTMTITSMLGRVSLTEHEEECVLLVEGYLAWHLDNAHEIPKSFFDVSSRTEENMFIWRVAVSFFAKRNCYDYDQFIPTLMKVSTIVQELVNLPDQDFQIKQVLLLAKALDYSDEAGRRILIQCLKGMVANEDLAQENRKIVFELLLIVFPQESIRSRVLLEILSDVVDPGRDDLEQEEEELTEGTQFVALSICENILLYTKKNFDHPEVAGLEPIILNGVRSPNSVVRQQALHALALFALLGKTGAMDYLLLFVQALMKDANLDIRLCAMHVLSDILLVFGKECVQDQEKTWPHELIADDRDDLDCSANLPLSLRAIIQHLRHPDKKIRNIAIEACAKLMVADIFSDDRVLRALILLHFHPASDGIAKSSIKCFFTIYAGKGSEQVVEKHLASLSAAFLPAVSAVLHAGSLSPLANVLGMDIANFILAFFPQNSSLRFDMAAAVLEELKDAHQRDEKPLVSILKDLLQFDLSSAQASYFVRKIRILRRTIKDGKSITLLDKICSEIRQARCETMSEDSPELESVVQKKVVPRAKKKKPVKAKACLKTADKLVNQLVPDMVEEDANYWKKVDDYDLPCEASQEPSRSALYVTPQNHVAPVEVMRNGAFAEPRTPPSPRFEDEEPTGSRKRARGYKSVGSSKRQGSSSSESPSSSSSGSPASPFAFKESDPSPKVTFVKQTKPKISKRRSVTKKPRNEICVAFTGFSKSLGPGCDSAALAQQVGIAKKLGLKVLLGNVFESSVTHLIFPRALSIPNLNMKLLLAIITKKKIVSPQWLIECEAKHMVVPDSPYASQSSVEPFRGKKVFVSQEFLRDNPRCPMEVLTMMVEGLGEGTLIHNRRFANYVLIGNTEADDLAGHRNMTFRHLCAFLLEGMNE